MAIGIILARDFGVRPVEPIEPPQGGNLRVEEQPKAAPKIQQTPILPIHMDGAALDELFRSCMPRLQRTARQMLRNPEDCEDAMQEGLLLAFKNLHQFEGRSTFMTWLHTIVRNSARTHVRKMKSRPKCSLEEELADENESAFQQHFVDPGPSPEDECSRRERSRVLRDVVRELPSIYGRAMHLCDISGIEQKQATQILGISSCALKTCLFRARRLAARRIHGKYCVPGQHLRGDESLGRMETARLSAA